jgi:hypothetical protein
MWTLSKYASSGAFLASSSTQVPLRLIPDPDCSLCGSYSKSLNQFSSRTQAPCLRTTRRKYIRHKQQSVKHKRYIYELQKNILQTSRSIISLLHYALYAFSSLADWDHEVCFVAFRNKMSTHIFQMRTLQLCIHRSPGSPPAPESNFSLQGSTHYK